jgi:hypothetical protein
MTDIVTKADLARIQDAYPDLNVQPLTSVEERVAIGVCRGLTVAQSARSVGMSMREAKALQESDAFLTVCDYLREVKYAYEQVKVAVTRDQLNMMLFEAHRKAANTTEEVAAIRELGKMNDLYLNEQRKSGVEINILPGDVTSEKQLERMDDDKLIELSGSDFRLSSETPIETESIG